MPAGAVDLLDVHESSGRCCRPWGECDGWHLVFGNAVQFTVPIRATGHQGLRRIDDPDLICAALNNRDLLQAALNPGGGHV